MRNPHASSPRDNVAVTTLPGQFPSGRWVQREVVDGKTGSRSVVRVSTGAAALRSALRDTRLRFESRASVQKPKKDENEHETVWIPAMEAVLKEVSSRMKSAVKATREQRDRVASFDRRCAHRDANWREWGEVCWVKPAHKGV